MRTMDGQVALVTGGGSGIGKSIADLFSREGCTVIIAGRTKSKLEKAAEEINCNTGSVHAMMLDITDACMVTSVIDEVVKRFGKLDILVNNASVFGGAPFGQISDDQWKQMMAVGLDGTFYCSREAFRIMKENGGGRIINIGSVAAFRPREHATAYSVCKAAVSSLTQSIALEGRDHGISATCLHPGNTMVERRVEGRAGTGKDQGPEETISAEDIARTAHLMATLPQGSTMLEAIVMPMKMKFLGRG